jgi:hypothetical protein
MLGQVISVKFVYVRLVLIRSDMVRLYQVMFG